MSSPLATLHPVDLQSSKQGGLLFCIFSSATKTGEKGLKGNCFFEIALKDTVEDTLRISKKIFICLGHIWEVW